MAGSHIFELRTYHAAPGKLDALTARFRDHVDAILKKHNMNAIGYWTPQDNTQNILIYVLEHESKAEAEKNWAALLADEEWKKVRAESETGGPLALKIDSVFMNPTEFSKLT